MSIQFPTNYFIGNPANYAPGGQTSPFAHFPAAAYEYVNSLLGLVGSAQVYLQHPDRVQGFGGIFNPNLNPIVPSPILGGNAGAYSPNFGIPTVQQYGLGFGGVGSGYSDYSGLNSGQYGTNFPAGGGFVPGTGQGGGFGQTGGGFYSTQPPYNGFYPTSGTYQPNVQSGGFGFGSPNPGYGGVPIGTGYPGYSNFTTNGQFPTNQTSQYPGYALSSQYPQAGMGGQFSANTLLGQGSNAASFANQYMGGSPFTTLNNMGYGQYATGQWASSLGQSGASTGLSSAATAGYPMTPQTGGMPAAQQSSASGMGAQQVITLLVSLIQQLMKK